MLSIQRRDQFDFGDHYSIFVAPLPIADPGFRGPSVTNFAGEAARGTTLM